MRRFIVLMVVLWMITVSSSAQCLSKKIIGKTYTRNFYALIFKHVASYAFFRDSVVYSIDGFFIKDRYVMVGEYYPDRFVGIEPKTKTKYVIYIQIVDPYKTKINKQGVDPRYKTILKNKPVGGWHVYFSVK